MFDSYRIPCPGFALSDHPTCDKRLEKEAAHRLLAENTARIAALQQRLYADKRESVIFLFQAMDAAGKDGTIRAVFGALPPQGVTEYAFKAPTATELAQDYLWRVHRRVPAKGHIAIFNRSHYEDVLIVRVRRLYTELPLPRRIDPDTIIKDRLEQIRQFESYLYRNGVRVVKFFLNVSRAEQARRFLSRLDDPDKNWKFSADDIEESMLWDEYTLAFEEAINATATEECPWYVIPADKKWYMRAVVSQIAADVLEDMDPKFPQLEPEQFKLLTAYRDRLEALTQQ